MKIKLTLEEAAVVVESLQSMRSNYDWWVTSLNATESERAMAREKINTIDGILARHG